MDFGFWMKTMPLLPEIEGRDNWYVGLAPSASSNSCSD